MPSPVLLSVVCLSSVCIARAPYSESGCKFWQFFYGDWYPGHPLTCTENIMKIVSGEPHRRGVKNIAILDISKATSRKRCKIRGKLLLITNRKSHISLRLVPKSVSLNDLERRSGRYFALFQQNR